MGNEIDKYVIIDPFEGLFVWASTQRRNTDGPTLGYVPSWRITIASVGHACRGAVNIRPRGPARCGRPTRLVASITLWLLDGLWKTLGIDKALDPP